MRSDSSASSRGWTRHQVYTLAALSRAYMLDFADRHLLAMPLSVAIPFIQDASVAVRLIPLWSFLVGSVGGPIFATVQGVARPEMRAVAAALNMFVMTLVGMGLGPTVVGFASDQLAATHADDSIRFALSLIAPLQVLGGVLWLFAARTPTADLKHVTT